MVWICKVTVRTDRMGQPARGPAAFGDFRGESELHLYTARYTCADAGFSVPLAVQIVGQTGW